MSESGKFRAEKNPVFSPQQGNYKLRLKKKPVVGLFYTLSVFYVQNLTVETLKMCSRNGISMFSQM